MCKGESFHDWETEYRVWNLEKQKCMKCGKSVLMKHNDIRGEDPSERKRPHHVPDKEAVLLMEFIAENEPVNPFDLVVGKSREKKKIKRILHMLQFRNVIDLKPIDEQWMLVMKRRE